MRKSRRSHSLQARVLALVGAGVFAAGAVLSLFSRSTLLTLERELVHDHQRLAASLARDFSRAVANDLRLLARVATASPAEMAPALAQVREFGRVTVAAFTMDRTGAVLACEPSFECAQLPAALPEFARSAMVSQRATISGGLARHDGRMTLVGVMPFRHLNGGNMAAAGICIDADDRRLRELLTATDIAPSLQLQLTDASGQALVAASASSEAATVRATVAGTPLTLEVFATGPDPTAPIARFRSLSLWLAPALSAVAMLLGWGIAQSVRQPLLGLTAAAERIAVGEFQPPIDEGRAAAGGREVARLATALERMRAALLASFAQIERTNEELEWRVGERTRQLAEANLRLEEREKVRQTLLRQVISAQEDERKRVARELHDETSQTLAALGMELDLALSAVATPGPTLTHHLLSVRRLAGRMHDELHRLIVNLRPSVLDDLGLAAAVRWLAEHHLTRAGIAVRCEIDALDERLSPEVETATFRVVQEALINITRHARADSVLIQGTVQDGALEIDIEDDGVGFDAGTLAWTAETLRGAGLLGMRERIDILGGSIRVDSSPGHGTRVVFAIPLQPAAVALTGVRS
jgi:signal transduction histidine kinase